MTQIMYRIHASHQTQSLAFVARVITDILFGGAEECIQVSDNIYTLPDGSWLRRGKDDELCLGGFDSPLRPEAIAYLGLRVGRLEPWESLESKIRKVTEQKLWRHIARGGVYEIVHPLATNKTPGDADGHRMVIYRTQGEEKLFVRDLDNFLKKFTPVRELVA